MTTASRFIVDSDEAADVHDQFLVVDDATGNTRRERGYRIEDIAPGAWALREIDWVNGCGERVTGSFYIRANDELCLVEVRVRVLLHALADDPPSRAGMFRAQLSIKCPGGFEQISTPEHVALKARDWREKIREMWSRQHRIRALDAGCPCPYYDVDVDVQWVDAPGDGVLEVDVHSGCDPDSTNSGNWYMGMTDYTAAHEFGHLLGLDDEYWEAGCIVTSGQSIMWGADAVHLTTGAGTVQLFHYHHFADWLAENRPCRFEVGRIEDIPELAPEFEGGKPPPFKSIW